MKRIAILITVVLLPKIVLGQIVQISPMKAGTHLLILLMKEITGKDLEFAGSQAHAARLRGAQDVINVPPGDFKKLSNLPANKFWVTHSPYVEKYAQVLSQPKYQVIFIYRDPRDLIVSLALYIRGKDKEFWPGAQKITLEETIARLIVGGESLHVTSHHITSRGVQGMLESYLPWSSLSNALTIRFEDLVGPQGGGSLEVQVNTIMNIAHHIGKKISYDEAVSYGSKIFGGTFSFRKGQIGNWKEYFTQEHKQLFKEHAGQLLIDLGYEKDFDW